MQDSNHRPLISILYSLFSNLYSPPNTTFITFSVTPRPHIFIGESLLKQLIMKLKVFFTIAAIAGITRAYAQNDAPANELLAMQVSILVDKIGKPVDSAAIYLTAVHQFKKTGESDTDTFYTDDQDGVTVDFKKNESGIMQMFICDMPSAMLNTAKRVIALRGMVATGTAAPPGFTAYATTQYAAF